MPKNVKGDSENDFKERFHVVITGGTSSPQKRHAEVNKKESVRKVKLQDEKEEDDEVQIKNEDTATIDPGEIGDEDFTDPQVLLKVRCGVSESCAQMYKELQVCNDRVNSKEKTRETCEQELYDYMGCVDHCVSKTLFKYLK